MGTSSLFIFTIELCVDFFPPPSLCAGNQWGLECPARQSERAWNRFRFGWCVPTLFCINDERLLECEGFEYSPCYAICLRARQRSSLILKSYRLLKSNYEGCLCVRRIFQEIVSAHIILPWLGVGEIRWYSLWITKFLFHFFYYFFFPVRIPCKSYKWYLFLFSGTLQVKYESDFLGTAGVALERLSTLFNPVLGFLWSQNNMALQTKEALFRLIN